MNNRNLSLKQKNKIQDEATLFIQNNLKIRFIKGETLNNKITFKEDINNTKTYFGIGFDIHRLIKQKKLFLGGIQIPYHSGLKGHSDGDVMIHALCDALLGAAGLGDIGRHFPDSSAEFKDIDSRILLCNVVKQLGDRDLTVSNVDVTILAQAPKMAPHISTMCDNLASDLKIELSRVNVKATTTEKMGFVGKKEGIAAHAVVLLNEQTD